MDKLKAADKAIQQYRRELDKEKSDWRNEQAELQRTNLKLKTSNRTLEKKNKELTDRNEALTAEELLLTDNIAAKQTELTDADTQTATATDALTAKQAELTALEQQVDTKKANVDSELVAYSEKRKDEIKSELFELNKQIIGAQDRLNDINGKVDDQRKLLIDLNETAISEQEDLKVSKASIKEELGVAREELDTITAQLEVRKRELQEASYKRDTAVAEAKKAQESHDKFLDYEEKGWKLLNAKDRELQDRSAEISEQSQFINNSRSFLPKL